MKLKALREQRATAAVALQALVNNDAAWSSDADAKYAALTTEIEGVDASIDRYEKALNLAGANAAGRDGIQDATGVSAENAAELRRDLLCAFLRDGRDGIRAAIETGRFASIQNAQSVGTPAGGGYLVPKQIADQITSAMKDYGGVRNVAKVIQTGQGNPIDFPTSNATAEMGRLLGENVTSTGTDALVLARVQAAVEHGLYGFIDWIARQISPFSADLYELENHHAALRGLSRLAAAPAIGSVTVTGLVGAVLPANTLLQRIDGVQYKTTAEITLTASSALVAVAALIPSVAGNAQAATPLSLVSPVAGIQSAAQVAEGGLVGGADIESVENLRARVIADWQRPAHGGADFDYAAWAKTVPGVTRVWVRPLLLGVGSVAVLFARDADASLIPDAGEVAAVQAAIDLVRPVTAAVTVMAPTAKVVNYTITISATAAVKAAIEAELRDLHAREAEPGGTLLLSHIREAVSSAEGEVDHTLSAPSANVICAATEIATFGVIAWQ